MPEAKVLIVDDEPMFQELLKAILAAERFQLSVASSGEEALELIEGIEPDLVLLDINLGELDGYETCQRLRQLAVTAEVPILFISSLTEPDDRLKAYGAGGSDYVSKPFNRQEVLTKVENLLKLKFERDMLQQQLQSSYSAIMDIQSSSAKIQSVSRFLQASMFCHDFDMFYRIFFRTIKELGCGSILLIRREGEEDLIRADSGQFSHLETEILAMSDKMDRIYQFGNNRAIYNWKNASLLVRNVDDMIDTLAMLMDGVEAGIKAIATESQLLDKVNTIEHENGRIKDQIYDLFQEMNISLKDTFLSLGLVASLSTDDEDRLADMVELFNGKINEKLSELSNNSHSMSQLINDLRTPPPELESLMQFEDENADDDSGIAFF